MISALFVHKRSLPAQQVMHCSHFGCMSSRHLVLFGQSALFIESDSVAHCELVALADEFVEIAIVSFDSSFTERGVC